MEIFGREYGFLLSVGAQQELSDICPGRDLTRLPELLDGTVAQKTDTYIRMLCILSKWHEEARAFLEPGYEKHPLTADVINLMDKDQFAALQMEAFSTLNKGKAQTVEAEPAKKNERAAAAQPLS